MIWNAWDCPRAKLHTSRAGLWQITQPKPRAQGEAGRRVEEGVRNAEQAERSSL